MKSGIKMGKKPNKMKTIKRVCMILATIMIASLLSNAHGNLARNSDYYIMHRSVKLKSDRGSCSGEQVVAPSGVSYILTAAHCNILITPRNTILVETEDKQELERAVIAEDPNSDLLLLEGLPNVRGLEIAEKYKADREVRTFTHGKGYDTYKTVGHLIQRVRTAIALGIVEPGKESECQMPKNKIQVSITEFGVNPVCLLDVVEMGTTAKIAPGSSGGIVVDSDGKLVGVVSAGSKDFGFLVTLEDIQLFLSGY